jgi:hypothetical protein
MKVAIKSFDVAMDVKQSGIELQINSPDGTKHHGDCYVTMSGLVWCKGRTKKTNGAKISWEQLMQICESKDSLKAALKAAKDA